MKQSMPVMQGSATLRAMTGRLGRRQPVVREVSP